ncbi:hypothetical protein BGW80DRAFT_1313092, partial [Lactifluus volemus]
MLRRPPINLVKPSQEAIMSLIRGVLRRVYVDARGATKPYEQLLSSHFRHQLHRLGIDEDPRDDPDMCEGTKAPCVKRTWSSGLGSGYPSSWVRDSLERRFGYPSIARFS